MPRTAIELYLRDFDAAYQGDPIHGFRGNLADATPAEWDVQPSEWSAEVFGRDAFQNAPLSICDIALHVGGAIVLHADHAFGDAQLEWADIVTHPRDMSSVLAWLDDVHRVFAAGIEALRDDDGLSQQRQLPGGQPISRGQRIWFMTRHYVYHSGEVTRQRVLIRGSTGWNLG